MESDGTGKELITVRGNQVDQWVEKHVTFSDRRPKLSKPTGSSQSAYRHGRQDGARQAIGIKETGKVADWALEKQEDTCKISHMCDILGVSAGHRSAGIPTVKGKSPMDTIRD